MKLFNRKKNGCRSEKPERMKLSSFRKKNVKSSGSSKAKASAVDSKIGSKKPSNKQKSPGILATWVSTSNDRRNESLPSAVPTLTPSTRKQHSTSKRHSNVDAVVRRVIQEQVLHSPSSTPIYRTSHSKASSPSPIAKQVKQQKHISRLYDMSQVHVESKAIEKKFSLNSTTQDTTETPPSPIPLGGRADEPQRIGGAIDLNLTSAIKESTNVNEEVKVNEDVGSPQQQITSFIDLFACFDCFAPKSVGQATIKHFGCGGDNGELPRPQSLPREISFTNDSYCRDHSQLTGDGVGGFVLVDNMEGVSKRETNKNKPRSLLRRKLALNRSNSSLLSNVKVYVDKPSVSATETSSLDGSTVTIPSIIQPPALHKKKSKHAIKS